MSLPYIHIDGPQPCYGASGDSDETKLGYHAFFFTHVPFIPSFLSDDFTRMIAGEGSRIRLIVHRQIRFITDLNSCKSGAAESFDLRFVSVPKAGQPYNNVYIFFIGKVFHEDSEDAARNLAIDLWRKFSSYFPMEDPFNYPLETIMAQEKDGKWVPSNSELFELALRPVRFGADTAKNLIEIRKYEDRDPMMTPASAVERNVENFGLDSDQLIGYYPHPFRPTLDFSAMSRFLETFAKQPQRCVVSICLRPTTLRLEEQQSINRMMQHYGTLLAGASEKANWLALYRKERWDDLWATFDPIINQRNHLFLVKIQILGEREPPSEVVAALGSEIMNNSTNEPRLWREIRPASPEEFNTAQKNLLLMEYRPWRVGNQSSPMWRLSSLVTSYEAVGAFRLPVPPESGHMPGIRVRDEPFVMPTEFSAPTQTSNEDVQVPIGKVIHRGSVTDTDFSISLAQLKRHSLIAGSTGSGKTNTCLHLLTELWRSPQRIPFLVVYPIDKPDYRLLRADPSVRDHLLLFTLGDDSTSPFRFNPFAVPPGILVRTHISLLMRAFTAAFMLWDPLPAVYRAALRRAYEEAGFTDLRTARGGDPGTTAPLLSRFYEILVETAEDLTRDYGKEAKGNIRQASEIRIRDLLLNAGHVLNVNEGAPWDQILEHPTVMEIGRVGSMEDSALVMGFLLMSLTSHLASRRKLNQTPGQHITLIEEAHRLMSSGKSSAGEAGQADARAKAGEDFSNILAEVRGFNEGLLIAEQIPTGLVTGAIGNTYIKIMHWLEEQRSFELFADIMNLNRQQREYARTLPQGRAILRSPNGRPVLVQVADYLNKFQLPDDSPKIDDSDQAVRDFMRVQVELHGIRLPQARPYTFSKPATTDATSAESKSLDWMLSLPMQTCSRCPSLHKTGKCNYGQLVRGDWVLGDVAFCKTCDAQLEALWNESDAQRLVVGLQQLRQNFQSRFQTLQLKGSKDTEATAVVGDVMYCYIAHRANAVLQACLGKSTPQAKRMRTMARKVLREAAQALPE
jgi:hypothetical protein